jgi:hypothetical protein
MKKHTLSHAKNRLVRSASFTLLLVATLSFAQAPVSPQIDSNPGVESWTGGTLDDALSQSLSGTTIPMSPYTFNSTKSGNVVTYKGNLVGGNPFAADPKPVTIEAVFIPLILLIAQPDGSVVTFDPSVPDPCDPGNVSAEYRFRHSPLVVASNLTFNGVSVGKAQYIDGFMRAEFWNATGGSLSYSNPISWSFHSAIAVFPVIPATVAIVENPGTCSERGVILQSEFSSFMKGLIIPALQSSGVISPTKFAFFLTKNVVTAKVIDYTTTPPTTSGIFGGQHYATGSPAQTWARAAYTLGSDVETASHEIGEWMNDPLVKNPTPLWGGIGEFPKGCSGILEVGDPRNGKTMMPLISMSGYNYHVQDLTFFSWFYNAEFQASLGAGGNFSASGHFTGPAKACLPGLPPAGPGGTF